MSKSGATVSTNLVAVEKRTGHRRRGQSKNCSRKNKKIEELENSARSSGRASDRPVND